MDTKEPETSATRSDGKNFQEEKIELVQDSLMEEQNSLDFVVTGGMEESCPESENLSAVENVRELKDIRKLMSLNDKFRFKRELFVNSDEVMNNTLEALNEISSFEESSLFFRISLAGI